MKHFLNLFVILGITAALLFANSCSKQPQSKLMNEIVNIDQLSELASKIKDDKTFTGDEIELFNAAIVRLADSKDSLKGKTVGKIIEEQKDFNRKSSFSNFNINVNTIEMNNAMSVRFTQKLQVKNDSLNADGIEFTITNIAKTDITSIKGSIRIINKQNQLVKLHPVTYDKNVLLKVGAQVTQREFWRHDPNNQFDEYFRNSPELTAYWIPEELTFASGQKLTVVQEKDKQ